MGVGLYVCSISHFSGKTAICVGLGKRLLKDGLTFGYMKPLSVSDQLSHTERVDEDAKLLASFSNQECVADLMTPVRLSIQDLEHVLLNDNIQAEYLKQVQKAYNDMRHERDVVILEGGGHLGEGAVLNLSAASVAQALDTFALVIVKYVTDLQIIDEALTAQSILGSSLLGVVLNAIPLQRQAAMEGIIVPALKRRGVDVFAVLPQEMLLRAISVREMAQALQADILCAAQSQDELVENLMVGAMNVDAALSYFRRKPNKAVFTGGDRLDIQVAALETSTRCLVLTGNLPPSPVILARAEEVGVPIVSAKQDTLTAIEIIEGHLGKTRFHQEKKFEVFDHVMEGHFDFATLYSSLGLKPGRK